MRRPFYSMRAGIAAQSAFLLLLGMLSMNILTLLFAERDLIQAKVQSGKVLLQALAAYVAPSDGATRQNLPALVQTAGFETIFGLDDKGKIALVYPPGKTIHPESLAKARRTLRSTRPETFLEGKDWGVFWLAPQRLTLTSPVTSRAGISTIAASTSLSAVYVPLRSSQKLIFIYLLLNAFLLTMLAVYLFSRTLVNPLKKLMRLAEDYRGGDTFEGLVDPSDHEMGQLFKSLNSMVLRIEDDRRELERHVSSLQKANRDLLQAQEEVIRSEKLATVGRMAAGLAHEMGNPLGIVLGYLDLLRKGGLEPAERQELLDRSEVELKRIHRIIRQFLDFSRPAKDHACTVGIHALIQDLVGILNVQPGAERLSVFLDLNARPDTVVADPDRLKQVFLNVLMNALDSLQEALKADPSFQGVIRIESRTEQGRLLLHVSDNGAGIDPEHLPQVFDPFFTTKEPGRGTGLGLSVSFNLLESIGGHIRLENHEERGAIARIDLPSATGAHGGPVPCTG